LATWAGTSSRLAALAFTKADISSSNAKNPEAIYDILLLTVQFKLLYNFLFKQVSKLVTAIRLTSLLYKTREIQEAEDILYRQGRLLPKKKEPTK
jgi:BarA-like signal transduction histidine kinase